MTRSSGRSSDRLLRLDLDSSMSEAKALVKSEFVHAWSAYRKHAWGSDELRPLTLQGHNWYQTSLLLTPVDVLDALIVLEFEEDAREVEKLILEELDFDRDFAVNVFETNIRVMGGLLSAYELTGTGRLLDLAEDLGRRLLPAFDSPTGLPYRNVNLRTGRADGSYTNPAEAGTLVLEFGRLSEHTGNGDFVRLARRALEALFERRSPLGLVGSKIDNMSGEWLDPSSHIAGLIDSYYEYLLKGSQLFGDSDLQSMWDTHLAGIREHVLVEEDDHVWCRRVHMDSGVEMAPHYGALDAFFVGTLVLSGELQLAEALQESGFAMWNTHGLEPEVFDYRAMDVADEQGEYHLRPELAESAFYLFHATGDQVYRDMGYGILSDLIRHCRTDEAYAAVKDVRTMEKMDSMESFFLAETLKYLFLLFSDEGLPLLDECVFTTEAHPLKKTLMTTD